MINNFKYQRGVILIILLCLTALSVLMGQEGLPNEEKKSIHIIGKYYNNKVMLRWGPSDKEMWRRVNREGWVLQRATVPDNLDGYKNYDYDSSFTRTILPLPKDDLAWETLFDKDSVSIGGWISLYEKRPEVPGGPVEQLLNQEKSEKKAFFVGMVSADRSHETAIAMGLGWVDKTVTKDKSYIYRVSLKSDSTIFDIALVDCSKEHLKYSPIGLETQSKEQLVMISWLRELNNHRFVSYYIERSKHKNGPYVRLNKAPYVDVRPNEEKGNTGNIYFRDSVQKNYIPYYYRLIGLDAFGIESEPSEVVMGMGKDFTPPLGITSLTVLTKEDSSVTISWKKDIRESDFKGYIVSRSHDLEGPYLPLHEKPLAFDTKVYIDRKVNPRAYNYYTVTALDTAGNATESLPRAAMFEDKAPPPTPTGLKGSIDSNGIASISWDAIHDPTVIGYKVYSSNSPKHTFIMKSGDLITDTTYTEKVALRTLSEIIIYKVATVNKGFGYSELSEGLELKRYDIIPPSSGEFKDYSLGDSSVTLTWAPSMSSDLAEQQLWRKDENQDWMMIQKLDIKLNSYTDKGLEPGITYTYALRAKDDDGLVSQYSSFLSVELSAYQELEIVDQFELNYSKEDHKVVIKWDYPNSSNYQFIIYRSKNSNAISSYKRVKGMNEFRDANIKKDTQYSYAIRAVSKAGLESPISKIKTISTK